MKASELLSAAIPFYGDDDYMCHVMMEVEPGKHEVVKGWLKDRIQKLLDPYATITIMNYLRYTNFAYRVLADKHGQQSKQCHEIRIEFWRKMVIDLQNKGL